MSRSQLFWNKPTFNRVTWIDITLEGEYLVAGYSEGNIALFEVKTQKLIAEVKDIHFEEIQSVKFLSIDTPITFVTADKVGTMYKVSVSKTLLIYSTKADIIMKKPFKDFSCFAALQPVKGMPKEVSNWFIHNIIAFANTELVNVAMLGTGAKKLWSMKREEFGKGMIEPNIFCHLDWGYGLTPEVSRDRHKCLLAVAWGKILQIIIFEKHEKESYPALKFDGYYLCDSSIDGVHFVSESIIMVFLNKKEVRILYVPYFLPGSIWKEGIEIKEEEDLKSVSKSKDKVQENNVTSTGQLKLVELSKNLSLSLEILFLMEILFILVCMINIIFITLFQ